jgi:hypothetical protein
MKEPPKMTTRATTRLPALLLLGALLAGSGCRATTPAPAPIEPAMPVEPAAPIEPPEPAAPPPAAPEAPPAAVKAPDPAAATSPEHLRCWETGETITLASGEEQAGARRVIRLRWEPATSRVVQEVLRFDPRPELPPSRFTYTWAVDGDHFELTEDQGRMTGSGTLTGGGWPWSGWSATSLVSGAIRVEETARLGPDGGLTIERRAFGPGGEAVMTLAEDGSPLAAEECAARFSAVTP